MERTAMERAATTAAATAAMTAVMTGRAGTTAAMTGERLVATTRARAAMMMGVASTLRADAAPSGGHVPTKRGRQQHQQLKAHVHCQ